RRAARNNAGAAATGPGHDGHDHAERVLLRIGVAAVVGDNVDGSECCRGFVFIEVQRVVDRGCSAIFYAGDAQRNGRGVGVTAIGGFVDKAVGAAVVDGWRIAEATVVVERQRTVVDVIGNADAGDRRVRRVIVEHTRCGDGQQRVLGGVVAVVIGADRADVRFADRWLAAG